MSKEWELHANVKRASVLKAIPKKWHLTNVPNIESLPNVIKYVASQLSEEERRITDMDLEPLAAAIASGQLTSRKVTESFAHRAAIAHQLVSTILI